MSEPTDVFELPFYHMVNGTPAIFNAFSLVFLTILTERQLGCTLAHDGFKVGYDSILTRLDNLPQDDLINFIGYCESWSRTIEHHHDTEVSYLELIPDSAPNNSFAAGKNRVPCSE